tara:strand:+ start:455 stop:586 length:132 start_codon:yes stop_codon:yes gene_type:complete
MGLGLGVGIWWGIGSSVSPASNNILAENGDFLVTEGSDNIVTE